MKLTSKIWSLTSKLKQGFTLIELLVVIALIAIMITVGTVSYQRSLRLARDSKRKTDLEQIRQALETYRGETGAYPVAISSLEPDYITVLPTAPKLDTYDYTGTTSTYSLCASLESITTPATCNYTVTQP